MLTDLKTINKIIKPMGSLQYGIPLTTLLPKDWPIRLINLQDCFFLFPYKDKIEKNLLLHFIFTT